MYSLTLFVSIVFFRTLQSPRFTYIDFLQAAVGYEYEGKTEAHASQKGDF